MPDPPKLPDSDEFLGPGKVTQSKAERVNSVVLEWLEDHLTKWAEMLERDERSGASWTKFHRVLSDNVPGGITKSPAQQFIDRRWPELVKRIRKARGYDPEA